MAPSLFAAADRPRAHGPQRPVGQTQAEDGPVGPVPDAAEDMTVLPERNGVAAGERALRRERPEAPGEVMGRRVGALERAVEELAAARDVAGQLVRPTIHDR